MRASFFEEPGAVAQPVTLQVMAGMLWIKSGEVIQRRAALTDLKIGNLRPGARKLTLPDGSWCEVAEQPGLTEILEQLQGDTVLLTPRPKASLAQNLAGALVTGLFVLAAAAVAAFVWGVPRIAGRMAQEMPAAARVEISQRIVAALDADGTLAPSALAEARRHQIEQDFAALKLDDDAPHQPLLFRASKAMGAGVLTLPDGSLLLLDRTVQLARNPQQVTALLAHGLGHARDSQVLRLMFQQVPVVVAQSWWNGDGAELRAMTPQLYTQLRFEHEQERDADNYAANVLHASGIEPARLSEMLEALLVAERDQGAAGGARWFMEVHPATDLRARALRSRNL